MFHCHVSLMGGNLKHQNSVKYQTMTEDLHTSRGQPCNKAGWNMCDLKLAETRIHKSIATLEQDGPVSSDRWGHGAPINGPYKWVCLGWFHPTCLGPHNFTYNWWQCPSWMLRQQLDHLLRTPRGPALTRHRYLTAGEDWGGMSVCKREGWGGLSHPPENIPKTNRNIFRTSW